MSDLSDLFITLTSPLPIEKLRLLAKQNCRGDVVIDVLSRDVGIIPPQYLYELGFLTIEDRDKLQIAARLTERNTDHAPPPRPGHRPPR